MDWKGKVKVESSSSKLCTHNPFSKQVFTYNMSSSNEANKSPSNVKNTGIVKESKHIVKTTSNDNLLWHKRLGHLAFKIVKTMLYQCDLPFFNKFSYVSIFCKICQLHKSYKLPFITFLHKEKVSLMIIHTDVWDPSPVVSRNGFGWYVSFIDEYTCVHGFIS